MSLSSNLISFYTNKRYIYIYGRKCYISWRDTSKERHSRDGINEPFTHYILICATVLALSLNDDQSSELTFRFIYSLEGSLNRWEFRSCVKLIAIRIHSTRSIIKFDSFRTSPCFLTSRSFHNVISISFFASSIRYSLLYYNNYCIKKKTS